MRPRSRDAPPLVRRDEPRGRIVFVENGIQDLRMIDRLSGVCVHVTDAGDPVLLAYRRMGDGRFLVVRFTGRTTRVRAGLVDFGVLLDMVPLQSIRVPALLSAGGSSLNDALHEWPLEIRRALEAYSSTTSRQG